MIRVAVFDRQPAVRAGVEALLRAHAGFEPVGTAEDARSAVALLYRTDPDVLVLDDLALARRLKIESPRVRVVLYAAELTPELLLAAEVAGVDGVADKAAPTFELLGVLRCVAAGAHAVPAVDPRQQSRAARRLDPRDRPIFAMRLAGTTPRDIADVIGVGVAALNARIQAIVAQLVPSPQPA
jgi:DNA-binding NarL/FixJ family response regulator